MRGQLFALLFALLPCGASAYTHGRAHHPLLPFLERDHDTTAPLCVCAGHHTETSECPPGAPVKTCEDKKDSKDCAGFFKWRGTKQAAARKDNSGPTGEDYVKCRSLASAPPRHPSTLHPWCGGVAGGARAPPP